MTLYEKLKIKFCNEPLKPSFSEALFLSSISGAVASLVTNPLDIVKIRMQVQNSINTNTNTNINTNIN